MRESNIKNVGRGKPGEIMPELCKEIQETYKKYFQQLMHEMSDGLIHNKDSELLYKQFHERESKTAQSARKLLSLQKISVSDNLGVVAFPRSNRTVSVALCSKRYESGGWNPSEGAKLYTFDLHDKLIDEKKK